MRIYTYVHSLRVARRHKIPLTWWNLRALWRQSKTGWLQELPALDLTEEEWVAWMQTMDEM